MPHRILLVPQPIGTVLEHQADIDDAFDFVFAVRFFCVAIADLLVFAWVLAMTRRTAAAAAAAAAAVAVLDGDVRCPRLVGGAL